MLLRFGNLTVTQFEQRVGTEFLPDEREFLEARRQETAQTIQADRFHIFDDPAISITIGVEALEACAPVFMCAHRRAPFNREVSFFPVRADGDDV